MTGQPSRADGQAGGRAASRGRGGNWAAVVPEAGTNPVQKPHLEDRFPEAEAEGGNWAGVVSGSGNDPDQKPGGE